MAFGITELINNIQSSINGLVSDLKGGGASGVPTYFYNDTDFKAIQSQIQQENWSKLSFPYTFAVIDITNQGNNGGFSDFALPLAPQSIKQKEPPAIAIRPTQGGTTVHHGGMGYKDLLISGTTGNAPFRGEGGANRKTGEGIFQPKELKYKSGFEVFLHFRNWLRTYYEFKKKRPNEGKNLRLVFKNYKDGEFLIVELLSFEMDRAAGKPFMYDYNVEFKVLSHLEFNRATNAAGPLSEIENGIQNALDKITLARGVFLRTQGILRQVESTYDASVLEPLRQATLAMKALLGVPTTAADVGSRIIVNTVSTAKALLITVEEGARMIALSATGAGVAASINATLDQKKGTLSQQLTASQKAVQQNGSQGLATMEGLLTLMSSNVFPPETLDAVAEEQSRAESLPRSYYENSIKELQRVKQNAEDFFNLGSPSYDALFDRTATLSADPTKLVTNDEYDVLFAFNEAITGLDFLLSTTDLFKSDYDERIQDMINRFNGNIELLANQAVKQITVNKGDTLERIALRELGDSNRWGEIVEVNGLRAPYLSEDPQESRQGVVKVGGKLLVAVPLQSGFSEVPQGKDNKLTLGMSEVERSLGVDLKISKDFDLVLTSSGDLELVAGGANMAQATFLKLSYEPGDVIRHPSLGAGLTIGNKFPNVSDIKDLITNTLLQDPRIQRVDDLALQRDGGSLSITFNLRIKNVDIPIPVKIKV